jgi:hypothetical protein
VQISAAGALSVTGTIKTNAGTVAASGNFSGGGGGSGGDILLEGVGVTHSGTLSANGAAGGAGQGGSGTACSGGTNNGTTQVAPTTPSATLNGYGGCGAYGFIVINSH